MPDATLRAVVIDVDNTLYDWVGFFIPCHQAMVAEISRISGIDLLSVRASFRRLYQRHRTTEYAFAIEELDTLSVIDSGLSPAERLEKYHSAVLAFRDCRREKLRLYDGVTATLVALRAMGAKLIAHSDSMIVPVSRRLRQLDIDRLFDLICGTKDSGIPDYLPLNVARRADSRDVEARAPLLELPPTVRKPDVAALRYPLERIGVALENSIYVGDSVTRDLAMAKAAGVTAVLAAYGRVVDPEQARYLEQITWWPDAEVHAERDGIDLTPDHTIYGFAELLSYVERTFR